MRPAKRLASGAREQDPTAFARRSIPAGPLKPHGTEVGSSAPASLRPRMRSGPEYTL